MPTSRRPSPKTALRFVLVMGVVNLFADMTYEGARGVAGAFLGHLGANGLAVGAIAGGGELAGYLIRSVSGAIADRTGRYWINAWVGYALNMLCVPALALAGSWPAAAGLLVGERVGRGIRKPITAVALAEAGRQIGSGRAFGLNELLDQIGATAGPLIVAAAIVRGGYTAGFGVLIVPALITLAVLSVAVSAGRGLIPRDREEPASAKGDPAALRRYAIGGALFAAGYVDFSLISLHYSRDHVMNVPAIAVSFAIAMAVGAVTSPIAGHLFDKLGKSIVGIALAVTALASPLAFLGRGPAAFAGAALWGVGTAVQDALLLALVATVAARRRRATTFGLYDLAFGIAWFAGSVLCGFLLDRSLVGLVVFSMLLQLLAIPFFLAKPGHDGAALKNIGR
ncbi:MAG TPA: MFS transporter [Candidatus Cybelea sp.]|nr:MFS transporter [Candidatus Cybelea sp.]